MERGLVDVHQALRELKPAESLAGFEDAIRNLSFKIEQMGGVSHDPAFLQQLEAAITALRGIVSHVASNDSARACWPTRCAACPRKSSASPALRCERPRHERAGQINRQRSPNSSEIPRGGPALPPRIESLLNSVSDRMERNELSSGEHFALGNLEDRIVASPRSSTPPTRGSISSARSSAAWRSFWSISRTCARRAERRRRATRSSAKSPAKSPRNTSQDSIEAVHGTVDAVVDRLALLETERRDPVAPPAPARLCRPRAHNSQDSRGGYRRRR